MDPLIFNQDVFLNIGRILAPLVVIALFIERAVDVLLTPVRGDKANKMEGEIAQLTDPNEIKNKQKELKNHKLTSRRWAFFCAVVFGLIASVLGVRGLYGLLDSSSPPSTAFNIFDILLTGIVLGGGADGIHKIVRAFTDYMEMISRKSQP